MDFLSDNQMSQECPVCYEVIQGDMIRPLDCGHIICLQCSYRIKPPRCPMCRSEFYNDCGTQSPDSEDTLHIMSITNPIEIPSYDSDEYNDPDDFIVSNNTTRRRRRRQRTIVGSAPDMLVTAQPLPISQEEAETIIAELMGTREQARSREDRRSTNDKLRQIRRNNRNRWRDGNMNHGSDE